MPYLATPLWCREDETVCHYCCHFVEGLFCPCCLYGMIQQNVVLERSHYREQYVSDKRDYYLEMSGSDVERLAIFRNNQKARANGSDDDGLPISTAAAAMTSSSGTIEQSEQQEKEQEVPAPPPVLDLQEKKVFNDMCCDAVAACVGAGGGCWVSGPMGSAALTMKHLGDLFSYNTHDGINLYPRWERGCGTHSDREVFKNDPLLCTMSRTTDCAAICCRNLKNCAGSEHEEKSLHRSSRGEEDFTCVDGILTLPFWLPLSLTWGLGAMVFVPHIAICQVSRELSMHRSRLWWRRGGVCQLLAKRFPYCSPPVPLFCHYCLCKDCSTLPRRFDSSREMKLRYVLFYIRRYGKGKMNLACQIYDVVYLSAMYLDYSTDVGAVAGSKRWIPVME